MHQLRHFIKDHECECEYCRMRRGRRPGRDKYGRNAMIPIQPAPAASTVFLPPKAPNMPSILSIGSSNPQDALNRPVPRYPGMQ